MSTVASIGSSTCDSRNGPNLRALVEPFPSEGCCPPADRQQSCLRQLLAPAAGVERLRAIVQAPEFRFEGFL